MSKKISVAGLTLGDPFSLTSRSGVNYNVFSRLRNKCELVDVFDLDLSGLSKVTSALVNFSFSRQRWGNKLHQNPWAFDVRTRMAARKLRHLQADIDVIYQDGAMFMPGYQPEIPFVSYHDSNVLLSVQGGRYAHGVHYKGEKLKKTIAQEKMVYEKAAYIFAMSDWLKESLIDDFSIPEEKIKTIYAGTNLKAVDFEKTYDGRTILFIGKNFERKGGYVLLEAFKHVKKEIKDSRLIIIGSDIKIDEDGVEVKGLVFDKNEIEKYLKQSSIFVLPSLFEPFGIVFAEAFTFKNPCIGTNICAMPEIIEQGKGGFLVPPNDAKALSEKMIMLLKDKNLSKEMGDYGFSKAKNMFTWDIVVEKMLHHCSQII